MSASTSSPLNLRNLLAGVGVVVVLLAVAAGFLVSAHNSGGAAIHRSATPAGHTLAVADPEAAESFPVSAGAAAAHAEAIAPSSAADQAGVSPAAPTDAEIAAQLKEMHQVLRAESVKAGPGMVNPIDGALTAPSGVPIVVDQVIAGGNAIADFPYVYGGGHASFIDTAYDCSGSVSYALAAAGLIAAPETSGQLESWGVPGPGRWITVYAAAGHTFMSVDGAWFDTAGRTGPYSSRWIPGTPSLGGYVVRHYPGL